ncbi:MAG: PQQ-binding-like beta-propeller repeat protein [Spirochaetes bacterium]|nr:PQQ-binding-like beta-propeller repeat protein [Spirochaetota bacterium]
MKRPFTLYIVVFLCTFCARSGVRAQEELFPAFEIEKLNEYQDEDTDLLVPLVYNGYVYIFSLAQPNPIWRLFIGGDISRPFERGKDTLYLFDIYNRLYAVDMKKGEVFWKLSAAEEIRGSPLVLDRHLVLPTAKGIVQVIDRNSGDVIDTYSQGGEIYTDLVRHENLIVVSYKSGNIVAYNIESRKPEWVFRSGGIVTVSPVLNGGVLYFGAWNRTMYALDVRTGEPRWISYVGKNITRDFLVFEREIMLFFADGELLSLSRDDGGIRWVQYVKGVNFSYNYFGGPDRLYLFTPDFIAVDPSDGSVLFNYRDRAFSLFKEMLFENMMEGKEPITEEERSRIQNEMYFSQNSYPILPPLATGGRYVYFVAEDSYLYVYDLVKDFFIIKYPMS